MTIFAKNRNFVATTGNVDRLGAQMAKEILFSFFVFSRDCFVVALHRALLSLRAMIC